MRPALTGPARGRLRDLAVGTEECSRRGSNQRMDLEEDEEAGIRSARWCACVCFGADVFRTDRVVATLCWVMARWTGSNCVSGRSGSPRIARRVPSRRLRCKRRLRRRRRIRVVLLCASVSLSLDLFVNLVLHAKALAFDDDGLGVMEDAIEDCGRQGAVVVKDLRPVFVGAISRDHHRGTLVALADDLEQQVGAVLVDGQVTELVDNKDGGLDVAVKFAFELPGGLSGGECVDDVDGGSEEHRVSLQAGGD